MTAADHQAADQNAITQLRGDPGFLSGFSMGTPLAASRQASLQAFPTTAATVIAATTMAMARDPSLSTTRDPWRSPLATATWFSSNPRRGQDRLLSNRSRPSRAAAQAAERLILSLVEAISSSARQEETDRVS